MYSYQIVDWGRPLERREGPTPTPQGAEVLMRVDACGVCHSDLHIQDGFFDLGEGERITVAERGVKLPFTMGHEVVGEVVSVGPDARGAAVGDKRIVYPWIGCGACRFCLRGDELLCLKPRIVGTWRHGGYSDHVLVPDARYLVDYEGIPTDLACTYACSGVTAYSALRKVSHLTGDDALLLVGAGGVGLSGLHIGRSVTEAKLIVADIDPEKRAQAAEDGADLVVDPAAADVNDTVRALAPEGVMGTIDFVGRPESARFAVDLLRKGGTLVMVGLYGDRLALPLPVLPLKVLTIKGSYVGTLAELEELIDLVKAGKVPPIPIHARPLDEANGALDDLRTGRVVGRQVLKP